MISTQDAKKVGKMSSGFSWSDKDLLLSIEVTKIVISFLEAKGERWILLVHPLLDELRMLESFANSRNLL